MLYTYVGIYGLLVLPSPSKSTISGKASEHFLSPDSAMPFANAALTIDLSLSLINHIQKSTTIHASRSFGLQVNVRAQLLKGSLLHWSQESAWLSGRWRSWCTNRWSWLLQEVDQDLHLYGFGWHAGGSLKAGAAERIWIATGSSRFQMALWGSLKPAIIPPTLSWKRLCSSYN